MNITLNGQTQVVSETKTVFEIAMEFAPEAAREALACTVNGTVCDMTTRIEQDADITLLTFDDPDGKKVFWHSASHVLAAAVKTLYPDA